MPTLRARRRRSPLVAAVACAALAVLTVLCLVLSARYARCNAARASSLSQQRAELMMQTRMRPSTAGRRHQLAVLIPYRDRPQQLDSMLRITARCLARAGADASMFVLEQAAGLHFNRGALLNAGFLLLAGSGYDCFVIHDVDTVCGPRESVAYRCPSGDRPLHLTPPGLHPRDNYPEFLGGNIVFTPAQFALVNGFQHSFWGWGKEDNNMVRRLQLHGMWPPERPNVRPRDELNYYWVHLDHPRELPVLLKSRNGANETRLVNLEPRVHDDNFTGLRETSFQVRRIGPFANATRIVIQPACDRALTPWCDQGGA